VLHRTAYDELGLAWSYDAVECDEGGLAAFVNELDDSWAGLSLTMPLKRAVLPLLDAHSALVTTTQVANTVLLRDGERYGDNTDVHGITAALEEAGVPAPTSATVLGGGATAVSALAALADMGAATAVLVVRSPERAADAVAAAERIGIGVELATWPGPADVWDGHLVVSTVPSGVTDGLRLPGVPRAVLDVAYRPWPTGLARAVAATGATVVPGLAMLVHQAARQVELMTGLPAPVAAMRAAGERALTA